MTSPLAGAQAAVARLEQALAKARRHYHDVLGALTNNSDSHSVAARKHIAQLEADLVEGRAILEALEADAGSEVA